MLQHVTVRQSIISELYRFSTLLNFNNKRLRQTMLFDTFKRITKVTAKYNIKIISLFDTFKTITRVTTSYNIKIILLFNTFKTIILRVTTSYNVKNIAFRHFQNNNKGYDKVISKLYCFPTLSKQ